MKIKICKLKAHLNQRECDLLQEMDKYEQEIKRVKQSQKGDIDHLKFLKNLQEYAEAARGVIEETVLTIPFLQTRLQYTCTSLPHINSILSKHVTFTPEESLHVGQIQTKSG